MDAVLFYRVARKLHRLGVPLVPRVISKAAFFLYNTHLPVQAELGEGTELGYGGMGVVIHPETKIGRNCLVSQQVTIGGRSGREGVPVIGDYVRIGAGAKVLGPIKVGDFAVIGANAVVTRDVARGAVVAGVPARELRRESDPVGSYLRENRNHKVDVLELSEVGVQEVRH